MKINMLPTMAIVDSKRINLISITDGAYEFIRESYTKLILKILFLIKLFFYW